MYELIDCYQQHFSHLPQKQKDALQDAALRYDFDSIPFIQPYVRSNVYASISRKVNRNP